MYMIDEHVACAVAGITADANILINMARLHQAKGRTEAAQSYRVGCVAPLTACRVCECGPCGLARVLSGVVS